jgi:hypothetical protein
VSIFSTYWLVKKIDMTQSAVTHLGRQRETPLRIASLHFEWCTFAPAAPGVRRDLESLGAIVWRHASDDHARLAQG